MSNVIPAVIGAASVGVPSGTVCSIFLIIGPMLIGSSMSTVPATVGVKRLRKNDSRAESAN